MRKVVQRDGKQPDMPSQEDSSVWVIDRKNFKDILMKAELKGRARSCTARAVKSTAAEVT